MGVGADRLHAAGQGLAAVRARRRRDGDGRRHPRRARPRARRRSKPADEIVDELLEAVVSDLPYQSGDRVALMINGLGGTPISELYILYGRAHQQLADQGITVGPQLRRRVLHLAGHGRRVAHPGQARRRDRGAARRAGRDRHPGLLTAEHRQEPPMPRNITLAQAEAIVEACKAKAMSSDSR